MTDELAARRATKKHPTTVTSIDHIADLMGQLMAALDDLGVDIETLIHRGTPIDPDELQALIGGDQ